MVTANSCPVGYELVTLDRTYGSYDAGQQWAEPDIDHAAWYMVKVVNDAPWRRNIAVKGHHTIRTEYSPAAVGRLYIARLRALERRHGVAVVSRAAA